MFGHCTSIYNTLYLVYLNLNTGKVKTQPNVCRNMANFQSSINASGVSFHRELVSFSGEPNSPVFWAILRPNLNDELLARLGKKKSPSHLTCAGAQQHLKCSGQAVPMTGKEERYFRKTAIHQIGNYSGSFCSVTSSACHTTSEISS